MIYFLAGISPCEWPETASGSKARSPTHLIANTLGARHDGTRRGNGIRGLRRLRIGLGAPRDRGRGRLPDDCVTAICGGVEAAAGNSTGPNDPTAQRSALQLSRCCCGISSRQRESGQRSRQKPGSCSVCRLCHDNFSGFASRRVEDERAQSILFFIPV